MNNLNPRNNLAPLRAVGQVALFLLCVAGVLAVGCGSRKDEDNSTRKAQEGNGQKGASLVVAGKGTAADSVAVSSSCEVELKQSSTFDPAQTNTQVQVIFSGKVASKCVSSGKQAEVLLFSKGKLTIPRATCAPENGEFNIKCAGDIVKSDSSGALEISFDGRDNLEQLKSLRVKVRYADPS